MGSDRRPEVKALVQQELLEAHDRLKRIREVLDVTSSLESTKQMSKHPNGLKWGGNLAQEAQGQIRIIPQLELRWDSKEECHLFWVEVAQLLKDQRMNKYSPKSSSTEASFRKGLPTASTWASGEGIAIAVEQGGTKAMQVETALIVPEGRVLKTCHGVIRGEKNLLLVPGPARPRTDYR